MEEEIEVIQENQENMIDLITEGNESIINLEQEDIIVNYNSDYNNLSNKPSINNVELQGNKTSQDLKVQPEGDYPEEVITNTDIEIIINNFV